MINFETVWHTKSIWKNQSWSPIEWVYISEKPNSHAEVLTLEIHDSPELSEWQTQGSQLVHQLFYIHKKSNHADKSISLQFTCENPSSEECSAFWRGFWLTVDAVIRKLDHQTREELRNKTPLKVHVSTFKNDTERIWAYAVWWVRSLQEAPENQRPLSLLVQWCKHWLKKLPVQGKIMKNPKELTALHAYANGSEDDYYFLDYTYLPKKGGKDVVGLIGKGVAFDAGGMALKPSMRMDLMKMDYSGGLIAFAVFRTCSYLQCKQNLVCLIPLTKNLMLGPKTIKPGDVIPLLRNQNTIEITDPDAEGRVLLAEASLYAQKYYPKLSEVILLGTITGQIDKIGNGIYSGLFVKSQTKNEQEIRDAWEISGNATQEFVWDIPLDKGMKPSLRSPVADYQNVDETCRADLLWSGLFLSDFWRKKSTWSYLDLGGTIESPFDQPWAPKICRGVGVQIVRTFLTER